MTTDATPIIGPPIVTHRQAVLTFTAKRRTDNGYTVPALNSIFKAYAHACAATGVSFAVCAAQVAHETGWLTSWWSARPRRNPAGIGVTGQTFANKPVTAAALNPETGRWHAGLSFANWDDSVVAHVGRLIVYAVPRDQWTAEQAAYVARATAARPVPAHVHGVAPTLAGLGGTWAVPGVGYGARLALKIDVMLAH